MYNNKRLTVYTGLDWIRSSEVHNNVYGLEICQNHVSDRTVKGMVNWNLIKWRSQHIGCMVWMCKIWSIVPKKDGLKVNKSLFTELSE